MQPARTAHFQNDIKTTIFTYCLCKWNHVIKHNLNTRLGNADGYEYMSKRNPWLHWVCKTYKRKPCTRASQGIKRSEFIGFVRILFRIYNFTIEGCIVEIQGQIGSQQIRQFSNPWWYLSGKIILAEIYLFQFCEI